MTRTSLPTAARPYVRLDADRGETLAAVSRAELIALYKAHGALLLRGFAGDLDVFRGLAVELCPVAVHNDSRNRATLGARDVQSVNLGTHAFPLHPELSREPWKPDSCFFYCLTPPSSGGATTICDGVAIVRDLPDELRATMTSRRLKYRMPARIQDLVYWLGTAQPDAATLAAPPPHCPYRFEWVEDQLARVFTRPLLHRPMFVDEPAFGNFLLFARFLRGITTFPLLDDDSIVPQQWLEVVKVAGDRLTAAIEWQRGDLLILDNSRFMHGRTAVTEGDERLIATYFGYCAFAVPDAEEPPGAPWRQPGFAPPMNA